MALPPPKADEQEPRSDAPKDDVPVDENGLDINEKNEKKKAEKGGMNTSSINAIPPEVDWEHVLEMYMTGKGTPDGVPLRTLRRGEGAVYNNAIRGRKLLEKYRTIGRAHERLGKKMFREIIGVNRFGMKCKMYIVVDKCRAINQLAKKGVRFPDNTCEVEKLIEEQMECRKKKFSIKYICNKQYKGMSF